MAQHARPACSAGHCRPWPAERPQGGSKLLGEMIVGLREMDMRSEDRPRKAHPQRREDHKWCRDRRSPSPGSRRPQRRLGMVSEQPVPPRSTNPIGAKPLSHRVPRSLTHRALHTAFAPRSPGRSRRRHPERERAAARRPARLPGGGPPSPPRVVALPLRVDRGPGTQGKWTRLEIARTQLSGGCRTRPGAQIEGGLGRAGGS